MNSVETLKSRREEAEKIIKKINEELEKVQVKINKSLNGLNDVKKQNSSYRKLIPSITKTTEDAKLVIASLRKERDTLKKVLTTVNNFYNKKFLPLQKKITDQTTGVQANLRKNQRILKENDKNKILFEKQLVIIKQITSDTRKKLNEAKKIDNNIILFHDEVVKNEKSIRAKLILIEDIEQKVTIARKNIISYETDTFEKAKKITDLLKDSQDALIEIEEHKDKAQGLLDEINIIYEIAGDTGLGGEFDKRRKALSLELVRWRKQIVRTTEILFVVIVLLFLLQLFLVNWDPEKLVFDFNFYIRFLFTSPIIYYLFFVSNQFNRTKSLLEKYSFKTTIAFSIESHIRLLTNIEEFINAGKINDIVDFILEGFSKIYFEPYDINYKKPITENTDLLKNILSTVKNIAKNEL